MAINPPITVNPVDFTLESRYTIEKGRIILSGLQALTRLPMDQHRADKKMNLHTGTLISGYRGSPLGGFDLVLESEAHLLKQHHVVFIPGVNEELAATAIWGSQTANLLPSPKYDGVLGMWYGKGPGVDRSGDAFRHANYVGIGRYGGVLALAGDDPSAKSSTVPSHSEIALYDAMMPVLFPGNVQEILDLGRYGFELSRYSGLWVGFKLVTNVVDEYSSAFVSPDRVQIQVPDFLVNGKPWHHTQRTLLLAPHSLQMEKEMTEYRLEAAKAFCKANHLNQITVPTRDAWLGILAAGKTYYDLRQALRELDLNDSDLERYGIRLLKLAMISPLEPDIIREFAQGLQEILVIEEKRGFIEMFVRNILYGRPDAPLITGKFDDNGNRLVKADSDLDSDHVARVVAARIRNHIDIPSIDQRLALLNQILPTTTIPLTSRRTAYFCSGCPHNRSTMLPEGSIGGAGIGCHTLVLLMDRDSDNLTQMGGEGANWVGASSFTDTNHIFQNLGDGTFSHSGSLAIRQAIAAGANITYKILYNSAVAMTGGQHADGGVSIPAMTRMLEAEGAQKIYVLTDDLHKYDRKTNWADNVTVWERDRLEEAQITLRDVPGVTVIIYDQECAANLRRKRNRGYVADPTLRVFINELVCEGCGDCGVKSNCLSVQPVETEFGRKTQIHQTSCNRDYTCLEGNCPAFITVNVRDFTVEKQEKTFEVDQDLPEPVRRTGEIANILLMGIGGTGVVTTNQIIGTAALMDGKHVISLDQTGLSQKGGPVVSNLKISDYPVEVSNKITKGETDCYIAFDLLTATRPAQLTRAMPDKTIAIVSTSRVPTGAMVSNPNIQYPQEDHLVSMIEEQTRPLENVYLDAISLAEHLFANHMAANMIAVGAAFQSGLIPISAESIESAIKLNGIKVSMNTQAFRVGRLIVADPTWMVELNFSRQGEVSLQPEPSPDAMRLVKHLDTAPAELKRLLEIRVPELIAYQNTAYAQPYVDFVRRVYEKEQEVCPGSIDLSVGVATYLYKLMAYKDEYEVARLHLKHEVQDVIRSQFGEKSDVHYMLHPPILQKFGLKKKIKLGKWFDNVYRLLVMMRRLRGTAFDPFKHDHIRQIERQLIDQYKRLVEQAVSDLAPENYGTAVKLANLPDMIRGYDEIKLANVDKFWNAVAELGYTDLRQ